MEKRQVINERNKFEEYLAKAGLRLSRGREGVFNEVMVAHGHFTAEELAKVCSAHLPSISRATVYRSLRELLEAGIIRGTAFGEKHQLYEHVYDEKPHHHARCIRCSSLLEFPDLNEDKQYYPILDKQGFKILGHEMHFYGICRQCQNKK